MSRSPLSSFQVARATGACCVTGRALAVGEGFVAALVERAAEGGDELDRLDFSIEAWEAGRRPAGWGRLFGCWRGTIAEPGARKRTLIDDAALLEIFEQLAGRDDPRRLAFRYVLALILIRKRLMTLEGMEGGLMLVRRKGEARPPEGPAYTRVADPGLDEGAVVELIEQLGAVMAGDLEGGDAPRVAAPAPAAEPGQGGTARPETPGEGEA